MKKKKQIRLSGDKEALALIAYKVDTKQITINSKKKISKTPKTILHFLQYMT